MKVLVLAPSMAAAGGIQRYTRTLVRALKDELGAECVGYLALAEPDSDHNGHNNRLSTRSKLDFVGRVLSEAIRSKPDLIVCTHLALGPIARAVATISLRPYWIVVHGIEFWGALSFAKGGALQDADRVIVTNTFNQELVRKRHGIDHARTLILPCTFDEELLAVEPSNNGHCHRIPTGVPVALTVGRMAQSERYKGHDVVLRALPAVLAKVPKLSQVIVGDGDDRPRIEQLAKELGLSEHVFFTGEISDSELSALYRRSDVFVLPARTVVDDHDPKGEGFGIVFLEAMAFGKPVVGPDRGAPANLIRHGEHGLLADPENSTAVAEALLTLLCEPDRASHMGHAARQWVNANYSYASFREQLRQVFASPLVVN